MQVRQVFLTDNYKKFLYNMRGENARPNAPGRAFFAAAPLLRQAKERSPLRRAAACAIIWA